MRKHSIRSAAAFGAAACLMLTACVPEAVISDPLVVTTDGETLRGAWIGEEGGVVVFRGVPYAAPPVGDLRWRPPAPRPPREGIQAATEFGPACIQEPGNIEFYRDIAEVFGTDPALVPDLEPTSEDCLYLNLWTTGPVGGELVPVMVWIHGGSNVAGSGAEPPYDGANLARRGAVVVTINYRLNLFGFLAHPAFTSESEHRSSGNYGLLDQIAALRWVQRNVAAFGGDPDRVTIFGESAGATDVAYLMASPLARGLFHRAVIQSGGYAVAVDTTLVDAEAAGEKLAEAVGVAEADDVAVALRELAAETLFHRATESGVGRFNSPNVDGYVLTDAPGRIFDAGEQAAVPLLVGFNADEWTTMGRYWPDVTVDRLEVELRASYGELAQRAMELYPASTDDEAAAAADRFQTDVYFACPARFIADRMWRVSSPTFFYIFTRWAPAPGGDTLRAYHGAEVPYAFDSLEFETWVPRNEVDRELAHTMADFWVRFAATGDPNGGSIPVWPLYDAVQRQHLVFGDEVLPGAGIRTDECALFDRLQEALLDGSR